MRLFKLLDRLLNVTLLTQSRDGLMGANYKWHQLLGEAPRGSSSDSVLCEAELPCWISIRLVTRFSFFLPFATRAPPGAPNLRRTDAITAILGISIGPSFGVADFKT